MVFLHEKREVFTDIINLASEHFHIPPIIIEKDYFVTMILRELSDSLDYIVFKGGTSLSKCYKTIKRFSEDIDLTTDSKLTQKQMRKLKESIKNAALRLGLIIPNIDETHSRRSYNRYILEYQSVLPEQDYVIQSAVLLETSFREVSFPTVVLPVHSYIGDMMEIEAPEEIENFRLEPFEMKIQSIDRTLTDKVFAICDYYIENRVQKHSRHIYDIYKLLQLVPQTDEFRSLVKTVRSIKAGTNMCPSAKSDVNIPEILNFLVENEVYREDYRNITERILEEDVSYDTAVEAIRKIAASGMFS